MKSKLSLFILIAIVVIASLSVFLRDKTVAILSPQGFIAAQERNLLFMAVALGAVIIIPVIIVTFFVAWKYREGNSQAEYEPERHVSKFFELSWWLLPAAVIAIMITIMWKDTHQLDPNKPLNSSVSPVTIQVVALQWKWLFIYPKQNIATVDYVQFPTKTPVNFELTGDAPMNSFWIPQLGGQMYAMAGMQTHLHLMANTAGIFSGSTAEISGKGFADMRFKAKASSLADFNKWVSSVKNSSTSLSQNVYNKLATPNETHTVTYYAQVEQNLFQNIMMKYTMPSMTSAMEMQ